MQIYFPENKPKQKQPNKQKHQILKYSYNFLIQKNQVNWLLLSGKMIDGLNFFASSNSIEA
jgi:hypothetical protein